jgi:hypothetical protein
VGIGVGLGIGVGVGLGVGRGVGVGDGVDVTVGAGVSDARATGGLLGAVGWPASSEPAARTTMSADAVTIPTAATVVLRST